MNWPAPGEQRVWHWVSLIPLLFMVALGYFVSLFIIPRFEQIYADALPGKPLPWLTLFFLGNRLSLALADSFWPLIGIFLMKRGHPATLVWLNLGILLGGLQLALLFFALFRPLVGTTTEMAELP